ncbi:MAG: hypothetical protein KGM93_10720, partial [Sphingomonadales bacterium]|nr:hypothetical protein [Sphingomonadales bacterium]
MGDSGAAAAKMDEAWPPTRLGLPADCRGDPVTVARRVAAADAAAGLFPPMTTVQRYFYRWSAL